MTSESFLTKPMLVAAVAGATLGAGLGFLSIRHATTSSVPEATPPTAVVEPIAVATNGSAATDSPAISRDEPASTGRKTVPAAPRISGDAETVRQRAGVLAQRGDVAALLAMREAVLRQTERRDEPVPAATTRDLEEIDRSLVDAREMRLKLDGAALRGLDKQPR